MKKMIQFIASVVLLAFVSCADKPTIEGLWIVERVKVGDQEMTPNARWMRFNSDFSQQSGNGWLQHSYGTWNFNAETNQLSVVNENGIKDPAEPFKVTLENDRMTWKRSEDGESVEVTLKRSDHLPATYGDELLGLWKLEDAVGDGDYFGTEDAKVGKANIFFRWDGRFDIRSGKGRIHGVYNVHGHKPEVELIPYGDNVNRAFWTIDFNKNRITLQLLNSENIVERKFSRIHEFPE
ncbi:hypothetical protein [Draconibacterium sediminis]|uniref:Lipocalin-like domain-containing protein n=1 Tax=Draconibacterium sediminis TaxID=1544798 RepID=A0A0D8JDR8_9BACT|nr:hypothetical protein [Draconibacterium sediminis]KJF44859.1 hypothetical protein LH29_05320 [Draconibacterium sediminis]